MRAVLISMQTNPLPPLKLPNIPPATPIHPFCHPIAADQVGTTQSTMDGRANPSAPVSRAVGLAQIVQSPLDLLQLDGKRDG